MILLYLILVAQFRSFIDPAVILFAQPPGIIGVLITLVLTERPKVYVVDIMCPPQRQRSHIRSATDLLSELMQRKVVLRLRLC